ncbi:hypothetical protein D0C36_09760 [Mucilaginibacter conchicola]|uniref:Uncharacterized protein n=1 Tax=Mucilaginibacter conchicola TaxID=2303333 RepID=A0A372NR49_9SPHI|nr:hypothetical protein D0C36_09760 [Mucilaginibacter conchicola]
MVLIGFSIDTIHEKKVTHPREKQEERKQETRIKNQEARIKTNNRHPKIMSFRTRNEEKSCYSIHARFAEITRFLLAFARSK